MASNVPADLRRMVELLRVSELQTVLRGMDIKKTYGKKSELVDRVNEILRAADVGKLTVYERLIRDAHKANATSLLRANAVTNSATGNHSHTETGCFSNWSLNSQSSRYTVPTCSVAPTVNHNNVGPKRVHAGDSHAAPSFPSSLQTYRGAGPAIAASSVRFKPLAFYDVLSVIRPPQALEVLTMATGRNQETHVSVTLNAEQISAVQREARHHRPLNFTEHTVQIQLRFCRIDASEQDDAFPSSINVRLNDRQVALPPVIPTNKVGVEPKRPGRPLDVTQHCRFTPVGVPNSLHISWAIDQALYNSANNPFSHAAAYQPTHAFALFLVRKVTVDELIVRLHKFSVLPITETRKLLSEKLRIAGDDESDVELAASPSLTVNLACPLSKTRMQLAVRSRDCPHLQCFDASTYLNMNEKKPTWMCPICDRPAPFPKLAIDAIVQTVLESPYSRSLHAVALRDDGSWRDANDENGACVLSSDSEDEDDRNKAPAVPLEPLPPDTWHLVAQDAHVAIGKRHGASSATPTPLQTAAPIHTPVLSTLIKSEPGTTSNLKKPDERPRAAGNSSVIDLTSDNEPEERRAPAPALAPVPRHVPASNMRVTAIPVQPCVSTVSTIHSAVKRIPPANWNPAFANHSVLAASLAATAAPHGPSAMKIAPVTTRVHSITTSVPIAPNVHSVSVVSSQHNANAQRRNVARYIGRKRRKRSETETDTESDSSDNELAWSSSSEDEYQKGRKRKRRRARRVDESDNDAVSGDNSAGSSDGGPSRRVTRGMRRRTVVDDFDDDALEPPTMVGGSGLRRNRVTLADDDSSADENDNDHEPSVVDSLRNRARVEPNGLLTSSATQAPLPSLSSASQQLNQPSAVIRQPSSNSFVSNSQVESTERPALTAPPTLSSYLASGNSVPTRSLSQSQTASDWSRCALPALLSFGPPSNTNTDEREKARFDAIFESFMSCQAPASNSRNSLLNDVEVDPMSLYGLGPSMVTSQQPQSTASRIAASPASNSFGSYSVNSRALHNALLNGGSNRTVANGLTDNTFAGTVGVSARQFDGAAPLDLSPNRSHSHSPHSLSTSGSRPSSCSPLTSILGGQSLPGFTFDAAQARYQSKRQPNTATNVFESTAFAGRQNVPSADPCNSFWMPQTSGPPSMNKWQTSSNNVPLLSTLNRTAFFSAFSDSTTRGLSVSDLQPFALHASVARSNSGDGTLAASGTNGSHSNVSSPLNFELN